MFELRRAEVLGLLRDGGIDEVADEEAMALIVPRAQMSRGHEATGA